MTWFLRRLRRWVLAADRRDPALPADIPPLLQPFHVGEMVPWKGVSFQVGKIVGGEFPCIILVPAGTTRGAKLKTMRNFRDLSRKARAERAAIATALQKEAR